MNATKQFVPKGLLLQWHLTNRCNLRCTHCYQSEYGGPELTYDQLFGVLGQYEDLLCSWRGCTERRVGAQITATGGEPFARRDFMDLLREFHARRELFSFAILTNGTFIDAALAGRLRELSPRFVQVSIEGTRDTHDRIRGKGNYDRVVNGLKHLRRAGVRTFISFTAHQGNYREFPDVAQLGCELGVSRVWSDRLIPTGSGAQMEEVMLSPAQTREFFQLMAAARETAEKLWSNKTEISCYRALQFLVAGGNAYHCTAGDSLLTIMPNGDVYPCRRLPVPVGNVLQTTLRELYYASPYLQKLRTPDIPECKGCAFNAVCRGGLRCLSHAVHGDAFRADPGCWVSTAPKTPELEELCAG